MAEKLLRFAQTCPLPTFRTFTHKTARRMGFELKNTLTEHRNAANLPDAAGPWPTHVAAVISPLSPVSDGKTARCAETTARETCPVVHCHGFGLTIAAAEATSTDASSTDRRPTMTTFRMTAAPYRCGFTSCDRFGALPM